MGVFFCGKKIHRGSDRLMVQKKKSITEVTLCSGICYFRYRKGRVLKKNSRWPGCQVTGHLLNQGG
jgi:ribosomal protein L24E